MTAAALPPAILRLLAALMLAVVGLHAVAPIGGPLERRAGSAFSAATSDVSLAGKRKAVAQARTTVPDGGRSAGESVASVQPVLSAPPIVVSTDPIRLPLLAASPPRTAPGPFGPRGPPIA